MDIVSLLMLAFGLGLLHALDADHIAAVSGLAGHRPGLRTSAMFCLRWAFGHGAVLLLVGSAVFLLGMAIPESLSNLAENMVGAVLIAIGLAIVIDLYRRRAHIHFHHHDGLPRHAHWHVHQPDTQHNEAAHQHRHAAIMVGALHGMAGSAPLLLLLPLGQMSSPWYGMAYLILFSLGVIVAMLLFGGVLGVLFTQFARISGRALQYVRGLVGLGSVEYGGYLLFS